MKKVNSKLSPTRKKPLSEQVRKAMKRYYKDLKSVEPADVYQLVMGEVEPEVLIATMKFVDNNQSRAAKILGLNRATLRKKLIKNKINL